MAEASRWKKDDNEAMVVIMSAMHSDMVMLVTIASSACQAWAALQDRYNRDTARSAIQQFQQLTSIRCNEDGEPPQHLDAFHQA